MPMRSKPDAEAKRAASEGGKPAVARGQVPARIDVAIAGGGLIGSAIAWALAERDIVDVCVIDVGTPDYPSLPPEAVPLARASFAQPINRATSLLTLEFIRERAEELGFRSRGSLWLSPRDRACLLEDAADLAPQVWSDSELLARCPVLDRVPDEGLHACYVAGDGTLEAAVMTRWFRDRAIERGVHFLDRHYLEGIETAEPDPGSRRATTLLMRALPPIDRLASLIGAALSRHSVPHSHEDRVELRPGLFINALGAWSNLLAAKLGLPALTRPVRRQLARVSVRGGDLPAGIDIGALPLIVDPAQLYFCPEGSYTLAGHSSDAPSGGYPLEYDGATYFNDHIWPRVARVASCFERSVHVRGRSTLRGMTPDASGVLGWVKGLSNVIEAHGFAGGGLSHCVAVGRGVAELIADGGYQKLDLSPLSPERFRTGKNLLPEPLAL